MPKPLPPSLYSRISEIIKSYKGLIECVIDDHFFSIKEKRKSFSNYFYIHKINSEAFGFSMQPIDEYDLSHSFKSGTVNEVCEQFSKK